MHIQFVSHDGARKSLTQGPYSHIVVAGNSLQVHEGGNIIDLATYGPSMGMWVVNDKDYWGGYIIST